MGYVLLYIQYKYAYLYIYDMNASLGPDFALIFFIFIQLVANSKD
jgi:hypothetical protein